LTSEGVDKEKDEPLRLRYRLAWSGLSGCTRAAYEGWALSVNGCTGVLVMDQHPRGQGTVNVVVRGAAGIPTSGLVTAEGSLIQAKRPMNDDVLVAAPTAVPVVIAGELELIDGDPAAIVLATTNRIYALFANGATGITPMAIGQDLTMDLLVSTAMAAGHIKRINWVAPAADVAVPAAGLAVLTSLTLTWKWAD
jgi:phage-related baseplate assembly protein